MPRTPKDPDFVDWFSSEARIVLLEDLEEGRLSLEESEIPEAVAWEVYKKHPAFDGIVFQQFRMRLQDHRKQVKKRAQNSKIEMQALIRDRQLFPRPTQNNKGEQIFAFSAAQKLLRADMEAKKHESLTPTQLWATRPEYQAFSKQKFKERIYQEIRYKKFVNYLKWDREKKLKKAREAKKKAIAEKLKLQAKKEEAEKKTSPQANKKRRI